MPTVESIQASGGDYTTPQAWYDDHSGDITADANAPYIGEMKAEQFTGNLLANGSTTSATKYFHLRAQSGDEFDGDFDGSYPYFDGSIAVVQSNDDYFRCEHIVVKDRTSSGDTCYGFNPAGDYHLYDGCGVLNLETGGSGNVECAGFFLSTLADFCTIRNCAIGDIHAKTTGSGKTADADGIRISSSAPTKTIYIYNNSIHGIRATDVDSTTTTRGIYIQNHDTAFVQNNAVSVESADSSTCISVTTDNVNDTDYNATTDATAGTNGQDNITASSEFVDTTLATLDLHCKTGGDCEDNARNLIDDSYTNAPTEDCDDDTRPSTGAWNIGIDEHIGGGPSGLSPSDLLMLRPFADPQDGHALFTSRRNTLIGR